MKDKIIDIAKSYLLKYPNEQIKIDKLIKYVNSSTDKEIVDWNNLNGHLTTGAFLYAINEKKFLTLYHKDLKTYLYPGGHMDINDKSPLDAAKRELKEETGLGNVKLITNYIESVPFDIAIHNVPYNERINLEGHVHFDFRYLFCIDKITNITIDTLESGGYKWMSIEELKKDFIDKTVINKLYDLISMEIGKN